MVISSRNQTACQEVADAINSCFGDERALAVEASISSKAALESMISAVRARWGAIDILVCNAASNPFYGPMAKISDDQFRKVFENNVLANHWLVSMVSPEMAGAGGGSIIIMSSIGGFVGSDLIGAYNISKAADMQLVRNLAVELGGQGVRVNAIAPGVIRTDFAKALYEDPPAEAALRRTTPLGRIGEPVDVAGAAVFLASAASRHVTGQTIVVDGGIMICGGGL